MEFPSLDPNNNYIYIKFATLKSDALLMYNHDNQTGDKAEFLALEILEGRVRFSFNLGSGTYKLMTMMKVSDGQFHTVIARRAGMVRTTTSRFFFSFLYQTLWKIGAFYRANLNLFVRHRAIVRPRAEAKGGPACVS